MKRTMLILSILLMVALLSAIEFEISGENRTRAAMANDSAENDGGWVDNRLNLGFDAQLHPDLAFRFAIEVGNTVWGNGGGGISTGEGIHVTEAFLNYKLNAFDANISIGQLYWMDKMGLILDDYFSGVLVQMEDFAGFNTEFAWIKAVEGNPYNDDDYNIFMGHANMADMAPAGVYGFLGNIPNADFSTLTLYPYISLEMDMLNLDMAAFMDMQMVNDDTEIGFGGAVKATASLDVVELGVDLLMATENGLTTISPWYQNGLYIYGIGKHHDGANLYWNIPYEGNSDTFISAVGKAKAPLSDKVKAFAAAGMLSDIGMEANAGIEYEIIPDLFHMAAYGAFGIHDNETNNYLLGTSLKLEF
jgi:hypothetical protein